MKIRRVLCTILAMLMVLSLCACGAKEVANPSGPAATAAPAATAKPADSGNKTDTPATEAPAADPTAEYVVKKIGVTSYLGHLLGGVNPVEQYIATDGVFDVVFKPDPSTKTLISTCLEEWHMEDDLTLIMKLKPNVVFNNGQKATAEDLLYSYTSFKDRGSTTLNSFPMDWDNCKTLDDLTVEMKFTDPYPPFFYTNQINLICKSWAESISWDSTEWYTNPVGSGPYYVDEYVQDSKIILKLRDDYWRIEETGPYYVDEFDILYFPDATTMQMELEVGSIDYCVLNNSGFDNIMAGNVPGVKAFLASAGTTVMIQFGFIDTNGLWKDARLREAVALAVNWEELGKISYGNRYIPAHSIATSECPYYIDPGTYEYNPEKAKALLAEAGYGPDNPLKIHTTEMESHKTLAEGLQFYLQQVGIVWDLEFADTSKAPEIWRSKEGTDICSWYAHRGSAFHELRASIPYTASGHQSFNYCDDEKFQELFYNMTHTFDDAEVAKYGKELQQYNFDNWFMLPFCELPYAVGFREEAFTEEQIRQCVLSQNLLQTSTLGKLSLWQ